jgi:hypothetical protein
MANHRMTNRTAASVGADHQYASEVLAPRFRASCAIAERTDRHARRAVSGWSALTIEGSLAQPRDQHLQLFPFEFPRLATFRMFSRRHVPLFKVLAAIAAAPRHGPRSTASCNDRCEEMFFALQPGIRAGSPPHV